MKELIIINNNELNLRYNFQIKIVWMQKYEEFMHIYKYIFFLTLYTNL